MAEPDPDSGYSRDAWCLRLSDGAQYNDVNQFKELRVLCCVR